MRRLILFRHAKAAARAAAGGDLDRPLDAQGRRDAAAMGTILVEAGVVPDLVILSPSLRTRETWELAAAAFGRVRVDIEPAIYDAAPEDILDAIHAVADEAQTVMVVGHNPGLQDLGVELLISGGAGHDDVGRIQAGFPTATAAVCLIDESGRATLEGLFHPKAKLEQD